MRITFLADYPDYVPTVAAWIFQEWGRDFAEHTLEEVEAKFRTHLNRDRVPLTLIALLDDHPVGTASLFVSDMDTRADLSPWLAAVYVLPGHRSRGLGTRLVEASEAVARQVGIPRLYLFTPDRESFYARLGWSALERSDYRGQPVVIMAKSLAGGRHSNGWPNRSR
jgi:GNAT superfamily N-acetyltransferase